MSRLLNEQNFNLTVSILTFDNGYFWNIRSYLLYALISLSALIWRLNWGLQFTFTLLYFIYFIIPVSNTEQYFYITTTSNVISSYLFNRSKNGTNKLTLLHVWSLCTFFKLPGIIYWDILWTARTQVPGQASFFHKIIRY